MQCTSEASAKNDPLPRSQWLDMIANPQEHGDMKFCGVRIVSFQGNKVNGWFSTATVGVRERHPRVRGAVGEAAAWADRARANAGDIYVYDLRTRHGGLPHAGSAPRPLLSLPYVKDWYVDAVNHPTRHTDIYNTVNDTTLKKLLVRVG